MKQKVLALPSGDLFGSWGEGLACTHIAPTGKPECLKGTQAFIFVSSEYRSQRLVLRRSGAQRV